MKKSLIWITAGVAAVGFGVPAFADRGDSPSDVVPTQVTVTTATPATVPSSVDSATVNTVPGVGDISGPCDEAEHANDPRCTDVSVAVTDDSIDDNVTTNSVEDISGPCDEAEHANDPRCTGAAGNNDDSGHDGSDDSGHDGDSDSDSDDD